MLKDALPDFSLLIAIFSYFLNQQLRSFPISLLWYRHLCSGSRKKKMYINNLKIILESIKKINCTIFLHADKNWNLIVNLLKDLVDDIVKAIFYSAKLSRNKIDITRHNMKIIRSNEASEMLWKFNYNSHCCGVNVNIQINNKSEIRKPLKVIHLKSNFKLCLTCALFEKTLKHYPKPSGCKTIIPLRPNTSKWYNYQWHKNAWWWFHSQPFWELYQHCLHQDHIQHLTW